MFPANRDQSTTESCLGSEEVVGVCLANAVYLEWGVEKIVRSRMREQQVQKHMDDRGWF